MNDSNKTAMKSRYAFFIVVLLALFVSTAHAQKKQGTFKIEGDTLVKDSVEYELIVLDPGYETFLATQKPASFFSQEYYETWNYRYVTEWNMRHDNPLRYDGLYETNIYYDPFTDYGLDLNYRLYYYFRFFEEKNGVKLLPGR